MFNKPDTIDRQKYNCDERCQVYVYSVSIAKCLT